MRERDGWRLLGTAADDLLVQAALPPDVPTTRRCPTPTPPPPAQAGIEKCAKLRVLYASNNRIKDWAEVERLAALPGLEDLLLVGNPLYNEWKDINALPQYRIEVRTEDVPLASGAAGACCTLLEVELAGEQAPCMCCGAAKLCAGAMPPANTQKPAPPS